MNAKGSTQDDDGRLPVEGGPLEPDTAAGDAQDDSQAQAEAEYAADLAQDTPQPATAGETEALAEADGPMPTVRHLRSVILGRGDRRIVHGAHLVVSGKLDGRTERRVRIRCAQIARDKGFARFEDAPALMQSEIVSVARLELAADLIWANLRASLRETGQGHLPDAFREYVKTKHQIAMDLGLKRELRDAKTIDLRTYVAERYGRDGEGPATPADSPDPPSSAAERSAEAIRAAQEAEDA